MAVWLYLLTFLLALWIGVARELRKELLGYWMQTLSVAALYALQAVSFHDAGMWVAFGGLLLFRAIWIPLWIGRKLPRRTLQERHTDFVTSPTHALLIFILLALVAAGITSAWHSALGFAFGLALATVLTGVATMALSHRASHQMLGVLSAANGVDLAVATVLNRMSVLSDFLIIIDTVWAVVLFVLFIVRLEHTGSTRLSDYTDLRG